MTLLLVYQRKPSGAVIGELPRVDEQRIAPIRGLQNSPTTHPVMLVNRF